MDGKRNTGVISTDLDNTPVRPQETGAVVIPTGGVDVSGVSRDKELQTSGSLTQLRNSLTSTENLNPTPAVTKFPNEDDPESKRESGSGEGEIVEKTDSKGVQVEEHDLSGVNSSDEEKEDDNVPRKGCAKCLHIIKRTRGILLCFLSSLQLSCCTYLAYRQGIIQ